MSTENNISRYFMFPAGHPLYGYYVEMIGGTETQAKKSFQALYDCKAKAKTEIEKIKPQCPLGRHSVFYSPLPEIVDIDIDTDIENGEIEKPRSNKYKVYYWNYYFDSIFSESKKYNKKQQNISNKFYDKNIKTKFK